MHLILAKVGPRGRKKQKGGSKGQTKTPPLPMKITTGAGRAVALALAASLAMLAASVYTASMQRDVLVASRLNDIYAETGMAVPQPATKPAGLNQRPAPAAKATTAAELERRLGKDAKGHPLPKSAAMHRSMWAGMVEKAKKMEDAYFHPASARGIKVTDKLRDFKYAMDGGAIKRPMTAQRRKGIQHWNKWENSYFQPIGKGKAPTATQRLVKYGLEGGSIKAKTPASGPAAKRTRKAAQWQKWEDATFGHTMAQVATARLRPHTATHARHFQDMRAVEAGLATDSTRRGRSVQGAGSGGNHGLIDRIVAKSWVNAAEVNGAKPPAKPVRFVDTIA